MEEIGPWDFSVDMLSSDAGTEQPEVKSDRDKIERDKTHYLADIIFLVEDRLYKVPRCYFEQESEVFRDMFTLPVSVKTVADGSSDSNPLRLEGIDKNDFKQLLRVIYPSHFQREENLSSAEWSSILKLSTMWAFDKIRKIAIEKMSTLSMDPIDKYVLAKKYAVTEWLVPTLNELAQRQKPIGKEDVERLGLDCALKVAEVREGLLFAGYHSHQLAVGQRGQLTLDFTNLIRHTFDL